MSRTPPGDISFSESLEALEAKRAKEAHDKAMDEKYADPAVLRGQMDEVRNSLYGKAFVPPEEQDLVDVASLTEDILPQESDVHDDRIYEKESPEGKILGRIAQRVDTEFGGNPEMLYPELFNETAREENSKQAESLFFSEDVLKQQMLETGDGTAQANLKNNQEWFDVNTQPGQPLGDAFKRIKGNFALPPEITGQNLSEIYQNNPEDALTVNDALADAFLLEIQQHTLKGRVNYPREQADELIKEITSVKTNPFEKLQKFGELHTLVNTGVARGGKQQEAAFRNRKAREHAATSEQADFFARQEQITSKQAERAQGNQAEEILPNEEIGATGGDIFAAGDIDTYSEYNDNPKEAA